MKTNSASEIRDNRYVKKDIYLQLLISIRCHDKKLLKSFMLIHLIYIVKVFHSNNFNKYLNKFTQKQCINYNIYFMSFYFFFFYFLYLFLVLDFEHQRLYF